MKKMAQDITAVFVFIGLIFLVVHFICPAWLEFR